MSRKTVGGATAGGGILAAVLIGVRTLGHSPEVVSAFRALSEHDPAAITVIDRALQVYDHNQWSATVVLEHLDTAKLTADLDGVVDAASERLGTTVKSTLCETYHRVRLGSEPPTMDDISKNFGAALVGVPDFASTAYSIIGELNRNVDAAEPYAVSNDSAANISASLLCYRSH